MRFSKPKSSRAQPARLAPWGLLVALAAGPAAAAEQPSYRQVAKLSASDGEPDQFLGVAVAIDGDTAVAGASRDDQFGANSGAAYLFERAGDSWSEVAKLTADDAAPNDKFGVEVAISGDTVIVGANEDDDLGGSSGSAYVFERDAGGPDAWGQVAKLTAPDGGAGDQFGYAVAIDGDTAIVGAYLAGDGVRPGAAYIYRRDAGGPGAWGLVAQIVSLDAEDRDHFGIAVSVSGDTALVGARLESDVALAAGAAYVFERDVGGADAWGQVAKVTADDGVILDRFGRAVAIDRDYAVIGAPADDTGGGAAYVFERDAGGPGAWGQVAKLVGPDTRFDDWFAGTVDISGDTIAIGADDHDTLGLDSGAAYVYRRDAGGPGAWGKIAKFAGIDTDFDDEFGRAIAIDGATVLSGADHVADLGTNSGAVYFFEEITVDPQVSVSGSCPGPIALEVTGLTPQQPSVLFLGSGPGDWSIGAGPCAGEMLDLADAELIGPATSGPGGGVSLAGPIGPAACGSPIQIIDSVSCATSNVVQLPAAARE